MSGGEARWHGVNLAVACLALDPGGLGGMWIRARVGPVRDRLEDGLKTALQGLKLRRIAPTISDDALYGGVDLAATLEAGTLRRTGGVLADADALILPMAERTPVGLAGRLAHAMDGDGMCLIALDEGAEPGEHAPEALTDRVGLHIDLTDHALTDAPALAIDLGALAEARLRLPKVTVPDEILADLTRVADRLGISSFRAPLFALAAARASAALSGSEEVEEPDLLLAVELVLVPRATIIPDLEADAAEETPPPTDTLPEDAPDTEPQSVDTPPAEILLQAAKAMLPPDLLARLKAGKAARAANASGAGAAKAGNRRGRPLPARAGRMGNGARVDLVATLRAAAPWQPMRRSATGGDPDRIHIRMSDIRLRRYQETSDRAIIFVVDASGSSAMARLAEAKGAVELLLAEAYSRRDHVALVAFRGDTSEVLLPPTRSLVQTKRRLSSLPGGGGTPLAAGLRAAIDLAALVRGKGMTPSVALLTDGRANVDLSGAANRPQAAEDATMLARVMRHDGLPALVVDTGLRPTRGLDDLAREMGAPYVPLPRADSRSLSRAVDAALAP
ncbi:magnesium chelatase subunit D [Hasllibacter sp. MH4015]|uniref:magnesium chelatase subunit D n=1 Tax=Hasllibacter sp. MH4015 TaxID=2854029 RepID=UPI001CD57D80